MKYLVNKKNFIIFVLLLIVLSGAILSFGTREVGEVYNNWPTYACEGGRWFAVATTTNWAKGYDNVRYEIVLDDGRIAVLRPGYYWHTWVNDSFIVGFGGDAGSLEEKGVPKVYNKCAATDPTKFDYRYVYETI